MTLTYDKWCSGCVKSDACHVKIAKDVIKVQLIPELKTTGGGPTYTEADLQEWLDAFATLCAHQHN